MEIITLVLRILFGIFFCFAGIMHFLKPKFFKNFIPDFLPKLAVNYVFGFIEILIGFGLFFNDTVKNTAVIFFILMVFFLPIHIWDATKIRPAIGSKKRAYIRIPVQFLFMYCAYLIYMNT